MYTSLYGCSVGVKTPGNGINSLVIYKIQRYKVKLVDLSILSPCCYVHGCYSSVAMRADVISLLLCTRMFKFLIQIA